MAIGQFQVRLQFLARHFQFRGVGALGPRAVVRQCAVELRQLLAGLGGIPGVGERQRSRPVPPGLLPRTRQHGQHFTGQNYVPFFELHQGAQHGEPPLRPRAAHSIRRRHLRRILVELKQLLRRLNGIVVPAFEGVRGRQVVDVVPVMSIAIELIQGHPLALVLCGAGKGFLGVAPAPGLRVDVPRHVQRVRNVGHQLRVLLAARPRILGKRGAFETVDDVVVQPGMLRRLGQQAAQNRHRLRAARRRRLLLRQRESAHDHQGQIEFGLHFARMRRQQCAHPFDEGLLGILGIGIAPRRDGGDVHLLQIGRLAWDLAQLHRLLRRQPRARRGRRHLLAEECAECVDLESRPPIAGGYHGDAPVRHGRRRVQRGSLQEAALRLARPEGMHLRHALVEELLRLGVGGRDRQMHRPHAGQDLRGQRGRERARRRRAVVAALRLLGRGGKSESHKSENQWHGELHGWFSSWRAIRCTS